MLFFENKQQQQQEPTLDKENEWRIKLVKKYINYVMSVNFQKRKHLVICSLHTRQIFGQNTHFTMRKTKVGVKFIMCLCCLYFASMYLFISQERQSEKASEREGGNETKTVSMHTEYSIRFINILFCSLKIAVK